MNRIEAMKTKFNRLMRRRLARFGEDQSGSTTVEAVMILPLLLWAYVAMFVYFDAFKIQNTNLRAAYTIADMISRQTNAIDANYVNGLNTVFDYLVEIDTNTSVRASSVFWDPVANVYKVQWSYATRTMPLLTNANVNTYASRLPTIPAGDTLIVMETWLDYSPAFDLGGLQARTFKEFIATRPRFVAQVPFV
jgi:Flp pilus assembly protein TadG